MDAKKAVMTMKPYNPPTENRRGKLRLDFNENTLGPSLNVLEAIKNAFNEDYCVYPEYGEIREKIAEFVGLQKKNVVVTNGGDEGIRNVIDCFVEERREIVIPCPSYAMFRFYGELGNVNVKEALYNEDLSFNKENVLKEINDKTDLVVLCNPNNPTGTLIKRKEIIEIAEQALGKNAIVLVDEAYYEFSNETVIDLVNEYENLVVLRSFSKAFGLAGLRIGFLVSCEKNIKNLLKMGSPYSVNSLAVKATLMALKDKKSIELYITDVLNAKKTTLQKFEKLGIKTFESKANFFIAKFGDNASLICRKLADRGILIRNRSDYPLLKGCLRIGVGTQEQMNFFVEELKKILEEVEYEKNC